MPILTFNAYWMTFNSLLALLPVLFGYFFLRTQHATLKVIFGILWLLFLPNTIYLFTDLQHMIEQLHQVTLLTTVFLALEYLLLEIIGILAFILAFHPFERIVRFFPKLKRNRVKVIVAFNFLIAFGMVLGRVERINSWEVFTAPLRVIASSWHVLISPELLALTILFGLVCNFIYFLCRDFVFHKTKKLIKKSYAFAMQFLD